MFFGCDDVQPKLLGVFKIRREATAHYASVQRSYDSISIRTKGSGVFYTEDTHFTVRRADVLYLPHTCDYTQTTDGETVYAIHFITRSSQRFWQSERLCYEEDNAVEHLVRQMYDVWTEQQQGYYYKCTALLYELLYLLNRHSHSLQAVSFGTQNAMTAAVEYIHKNYRKENIDIGNLARQCAVSETYFRRRFKIAYGVSPKTYVIHLKLEFAARLLESHLYTVNETAEKAGFTDTKYFSRLFKQHYGKSPARYKKQASSQ